MTRFLLVLFFCLLFFISCSDDDLSSLYDNREYAVVYEKSSRVLNEKFEPDALYYKAMAANRIGKYDESALASRLYLLLFSSDKDKTMAMERLVLHYGDKISALESGELLYRDDSLSKDDYIQFFKVLIDNGLYTKANTLLEEITLKLTKTEYSFCLINGGAPVWQIIKGLEDLYNAEGSSSNYLSNVRLAISKAQTKIELETIAEYLESAFDGNTQLALIIGDLFFNLSSNEKMEYYWDIAKKDYPDAVDVRRRISNS